MWQFLTELHFIQFCDRNFKYLTLLLSPTHGFHLCIYVVSHVANLTYWEISTNLRYSEITKTPASGRQ